MLFIASYQGIILAAAPTREEAVTAACRRWLQVRVKRLEPAWVEVVCLHVSPGYAAEGEAVWLRNSMELADR